MKVLITGGTGRLGRVLNKILLKENYSTIPLGSKELDLTNDFVTDKITRYNPDYIIHTAALSSVDKCEKNPDLAFNINTLGTKRVVDAAVKINVPILYISTDYVFNGQCPPYFEDDEPAPVNIYGDSKFQGEKFVKKVSTAIILRVSWLFGPEGNDFVEFVLKAEEPIYVIKNQISKPTSTVDLSYAILNLIKKEVRGIYHFANPPQINRLEWVKTILKINKLNKKIRETNWVDLNLPAKRPLNSTLSTDKYEGEFEEIRSWVETLKEIRNV